MYLDGHVRSNVDWLKTKVWPRRFNPNIDKEHFVQAGDGTLARITRITHTDKDAKPYLIIEVWAEPKT